MAFSEQVTVVGVQLVQQSKVAVTLLQGTGPTQFVIVDDEANAGNYIVGAQHTHTVE